MEKSKENGISKRLERRDGSMEFSGLCGFLCSDENDYREGDQVLKTDVDKCAKGILKMRTTLGEAGEIMENTHTLIKQFSYFNEDMDGMHIKKKVFLENGNGPKAIKIEKGLKEKVHHDVELRKKKIVTFITDRLMEKIEKNEPAVVFEFEELAQKELGIEPEDREELSANQKLANKKRHDFMDEILKSVEGRRAQEFYKKSGEEITLWHEWDWDYEEKKLKGNFMDGEKIKKGSGN